MARRSNRRKGLGNKTFSIIVDGKTEKWYFQMMQKNEALQNITIKPEINHNKKLVDQFKLAVEHSKDFDMVVWIIDFDAIIEEDKNIKKGGKPRTQELREYLGKLGKYKNVKVLINTPCLEFWYLLHFKFTSKYYPSDEDICRELKNNQLKDYAKTEKFYKKPNNDIYLRLKPHKDKAINNASKLGDFNSYEPETAKAEIYKIFQLLGL